MYFRFVFEYMENYFHMQHYNITIGTNGKVQVRSLKRGSGLDFDQSFHYYEGAVGNNKIFANRSSGAYIFRPKQNVSKDLPAIGTFQIFKGNLSFNNFIYVI